MGKWDDCYWRGSGLKTRNQWAKEGYVVKQRQYGRWLYTSIKKFRKAEFFEVYQVKKDPEKAAAFLKDVRRENRLRQAERHKKQREAWAKFLKGHKQVLIYDTETSGLYADQNVILSLSWQLLDITSRPWEVKDQRSCYFEWPENRNRVTQEAIGVNGLTMERLAELGTIDRKEGLHLFREALSKADLVVAHNHRFDKQFVNMMCRELHEQSLAWPEAYDTMFHTGKLVGLHYSRTEYKWPRLSELADRLKIDTSDINFHMSASDVEVTKRCFYELSTKALIMP